MKIRISFVLLSVMLSFLGGAKAAQVDSAKAAATVTRWLQWEASPLGAKLGKKVNHVETFKDSQGTPLFHVVYMEPSGFVIVSADDNVEPIIAFVEKGRFDPAETNPLGALVARDLPKRIAYARSHANNAAGLKNHAKWQKLQPDSGGTTNSVQPKGLTSGSITDVRIAPFVATAWNQWTADNTTNGPPCYNFFTPPFEEGSLSNAVCGCVATALAQLLYYYQYPSSGVGTASYSVSFDGYQMNRQLRGGDGFGGPYDWADMPATTSISTPQVQCEAIGALTYDAGVAVNMQYSDGTAGSSAYLSAAQTALVTTFNYGNAIITEADTINVGYDLDNMVNASLDAHSPVIFGIDNTAGGHCVVCDGYGYSAYATLYHHLNMGWGGDDNAWYQLPVIDLGDMQPYYNFDGCIFNVFTNGGGEIVSGRVLDPNGSPLANASVSGISTKGGSFSATTDANGIYAFTGVPSKSTCIITVTNSGYFPATSNVVVGISVNDATTCGDIWGANFTLAPAEGPPMFTIQPVNQIATVGSNATFYAYASGALPLTYQWQYQPSGGLTWVNLMDNGTTSGSESTTLTLSSTTLAMNGEPLQCVASNSAGIMASDPVTLTVNAFPYIPLVTLAGQAGVSGFADGANSLFSNPHGLAVDSQTNIYVADMQNQVIRKVSLTAGGWVVSTIAGQFGRPGSADGVGTNAQFNGPYGVAVTANGNVYVADTGNDDIRQLTPSGANYVVSTIAGVAGTRGATDGLNALFNLPMGIAANASGALFVADEGNHNIRELLAAGTNWLANTIAGSGTYGSNDGTNNLAQFGQPYGITASTNGLVFVADEFNSTIRQLKPTGSIWHVTTIAGQTGVHGSADGVGSAAQFKFPTGIAADANGNLYVADNGNDTIRQLTQIGTNWTVFTVAGAPGAAGSMDGIGTAIQLNLPFGVAVNNGTNVYVSDANNETIRGPGLPDVPPLPKVKLTRQMKANMLAVTWNAVSGHTYQLQYTTNLNKPFWSNLISITASNWTGVASVPVGADGHRFYRVAPVQ